jgi:hypothetical protein
VKKCLCRLVVDVEIGMGHSLPGVLIFCQWNNGEEEEHGAHSFRGLYSPHCL